MRINWDYCQSNAEDILAEGLSNLITSKINNLNDITCKNSGNYLITHSGISYYIGEAKDILKRLKQQFNPGNSTFYKNYLEYISKSPPYKVLTIDDFSIQYIETKIGRKEIEEFGIVNLPTILNKFQQGKRKKQELPSRSKSWDYIRDNKLKILNEGEQLFFNKKHVHWNKANIPSSPGIYYVLNPKMQLIYIGESSDINNRYNAHSKKTYFSALRRNIATDVLGFKFIGRKKLTEDNDYSVTQYLSDCKICYMNVQFGRYELEEYLIKKHSPLLNRKDNK